MCGIAGIWHLNGEPLREDKLREFTDSLAHRGPDGSGYCIYEQCLGLGHRRLSVLDLSEGGRQPMETPDGGLAITFNGEIYNFLELRRELSEKGYVFRSDSDTEVILAAYRCWGRDCQLRFNGMWALAIFDRERKTLFLSRDRFGVKPLHYLYQPNRLFAFASETLAFKHLQDYNRSLDARTFQRSLSDFSSLEAFGYTIYRDIFQLLPGHCAELSLRDGSFRQERWWDTLDHTISAPSDYRQQVEGFLEIFQSACRLRLRSDVPVASALSGGVDSSAVYCTLHHMMAGAGNGVERLPDNWQTAFVATFPDTKVDERHYAEEVVAHVNGQAQYLSPDYSNLVGDIESTTRLFDGLSGTPLICLTDVYKGMRQNRIIVSLDGHGVDELLFGYRSSVFAAYQNALRSGDPRADQYRQIYLEMMFADERVRACQRLEETTTPSTGGLRQSLRALKGTVRRLLVQPSLPEVPAHPWVRSEGPARLPFLTPDFNSMMTRKVQDPVNYRNLHYAELPYNLRDFDRGSMQHGIEIRMPFMDYRLVTYLFSLRPESKLGGGYTKRILRDAMKGIMPESIRNRKLKIGLGSPLREWFNGSLSQYLLDEVSSRTFRENPYIKADQVKQFVEERTRGQSWTDDECSAFWPILNAHILLKS